MSDSNCESGRKFEGQESFDEERPAGETVVQVHGQAPVQFNYINPSDDPSKR